MNNFPLYKHFAIKLKFPESSEVDERLVDRLGTMLVKELELFVNKTSQHLFDNGELTKVYLLSDSHLIIHIWPAELAVHMNLMTDRQELNRDQIEKTIATWGAIEREIVELE